MITAAMLATLARSGAGRETEWRDRTAWADLLRIKAPAGARTPVRGEPVSLISHGTCETERTRWP
jgi:hypothetical protein